MKINIRIKLLLNFLLVGIVPLIILMFLGFWFTGNLLRKKNFDQLNAIREYKKQTIEEYFQLVRNEIQYLSKNHTIVNAMREFKDSFHASAPTRLNENDIAKVKSYYKDKIFKKLGNNLSNFELNRLIPQDSTTLFFQRYYMAEMAGIKNDHPYHDVHTKYNQDITNFLKKFKYYDILLIDNETGHIIYSVDKEIDFATSLKTGPYSQSNIAKVFQEVKQAREPDFVKIYDFEQYTPSFMFPAMFIGTPVFDGKRNIGTLVFELSTKEIDRTMTNEHKWTEVGLGKTGESYIVGRDSKMRNDARAMIEDPKAFLKLLTKLKLNAGDLEKMKQFQSSILFQEIKTEAVKDAYLGRVDAKIATDYRNQRVLTSYTPLKIPDLEWFLVTQIDEKEVMQPMDSFARKAYQGVLILLIIILVITLLLSKNLSSPIKQLLEGTKNIQQGKLDTEVQVTSKDEIGDLAHSFNQMAQNIKEKNESLDEKRQKLETSNTALEARQWLSNGVIEFLPVLQRNDHNIEAMAEDILNHLTQYVDATQAAMYVAEADEHTTFLKLLAHRGHNEKFVTSHTKMPLGTGLAGTCAKDKEVMHLTPKEEEYDIITSATFNAKPTTLLLVPLLNNQRLVGVLEISYLRKITENEVAFVRRISERISLAVYNMKADILTQELLQEVKIQNEQLSAKEDALRKNSEELKNLNESLEEKVEAATKNIQEKNQQLLAQEEELRQNLEELNAINESLDQKVEERTRELKEKERILVQNLAKLKVSQREQHKLSLMLNNSDDFIVLTGIEGNVIYMNNAARAMKGVAQGADISHLTLMDFKVPDDTLDLIEEVIPIVAKEGIWKGELHQQHLGTDAMLNVETTVFPVKDPNTQEWICFTLIQSDITERKEAQNKLVQQEEELRQNAEELQALNESLEKRIQEATQDIQEKNQRLLAQEEELRQNIEELNSLNESLDDKVAQRTQELVDKEKLLQKNLHNLREAQIEQQKLATMIDNSDDMIAMAGFDGKVLYMNRQARKVWGISVDANVSTLKIDDLELKNAKGKKVSIFNNIFPKVAEQGVWKGEFIQRSVITGEDINIDSKIFTVIDENTQQPICIATIQRDITDRKKSQAKMKAAFEESKRSRELIQAVIDATPDWISVKDRNYQYILCNRSFARAFNRTKKQVLGEDDYSLGFPKHLIEGDEAQGIKGFREDDRRVFEYEHFIQNTNDPGIMIHGELRFFDTQKLPLFDSTGQVYAVLSIARDFTDRKIFEDKLQSKNVEITQQQQNIRASISYAKRIQNALLPHRKHIKESLPDSFILFKPRDIVSGDFYWFAHTEAKPLYEEVSSFQGIEKVLKGFRNEKIVIAAVDCTGHGVPGAFMSLIGNDILNNAVIQHETTEPDQILTKLNEGVKKSLKQQENADSRDGMDIALCTIDLDARTVEFAGAKNPLVYIQNGQVNEIKGSKFSIGGRERGTERTYDKHTIDASEPTTLYIYSDGYQDQFGGPNKQKFMKKRLRELLLEIHQKPMEEQKQILDDTLAQWMKEGNERQIDDVLVIGIRI
ncbi:PAS domain-containing protein [Microscilla marina]|uniref:PAS domain-containing protein n=1 Tax=Microscilla marina TaxID=1027 RepID=UPI0005D46FAF|nr:PAS domain-containing protein [Microscilla marina]